MFNALRAAGEFVSCLPRESLSPESTEDREGFLHPFLIQGGVGQATVKIILRDFETENLAEQAELLRSIAAEVEDLISGVRVDIAVTAQYRNMREGLRRDPRVVEHAVAAHERLGRRAQLTIVRGGTDGAMLTERGLPTPNLSTGQHNPHSPLEWACLDEMVQAAEVLVELLQIWASGCFDNSKATEMD
jgi:tripeptide aminopeptidase